MVKDKIKEPSVKRRNSLTSFYEMMSIDQQKQLREEMPSCFLDDVSFNENVTQKEEHRQGRVEWRAQFKNIHDLYKHQKRTRTEEKARRRDKSSDTHLINNNLITTINQRATEEEIRVLTELTFWEKIGFTNKIKRNMMLQEGKQKLDENYYWLRNTMIQSK